MSRFQLHLFGPFQFINPAGTEPHLRSDRVRALLAYLALTPPGKPVRRAHLAGLLWPGYLPASANQSLRNAIFDLRHALAPQEILQSDRKTVTFDAAHPLLWCDVLRGQELMDGLTASLDPDGPPLTPNQRQEAQEALALHDQEFLQGLTLADCPAFTKWLAERRGHFQRQADCLRAALHRAPAEAVRDPLPETLAPTPSAPGLVVDWGDIPGPIPLVDRLAERAQLLQWLTVDRCRVIGVYGLGGQGKTALIADVVRALAQDAGRAEQPALDSAPAYERIIWRSVRNAPSLDEILLDWIRFLSAWEVTQLPPSLDHKLALLLDLLRQRPVLLILDNLETILESGDRTGLFRAGYENYGALIERLAQSAHASTLLITGREQPFGEDRLTQTRPEVRSLRLAGLPIGAGVAVLNGQKVQGSPTTLQEIAQRYSGNPLALLLAARTVHDLFLGDANAFLTDEVLIFGDIRDVLSAQFGRLSPLEQELILWLAVEREPTSRQTLKANLAGNGEHGAVMDSLRALRRRLLVETHAGPDNSAAATHFGLQNVVLEYVTDWLVATVCQELREGRLRFLRSHLLMRAQVREYVRQSQSRLIVEPVVAKMKAMWGTADFAPALARLLDCLREEPAEQIGYAATNLLHLLIAGGVPPAGADFSRLPVPGAYLRDVALPRCNFTHADLTDSVFTDAIGQIRCVAADPTGHLIAAATDDGFIWLWRRAELTLHRVIAAHNGLVMQIDFSPDGSMIVSAGTDGAINLWDVDGGRLIRQLRGGAEEANSVAFSPDGRLVAGGRRHGGVDLWYRVTGQFQRTLPGPAAAVQSVRFSPDGGRLAGVDEAQQITLWHVDTGQVAARWSGGIKKVFRRLAFHPDGSLLAGSAADGSIQVWDAQTGALRLRLASGGEVMWDVAFSLDGRILAGASHDSSVHLWETTTGERLGSLSGHHHRVMSLAFCADGKTLISGSADQTVRIWDVASLRPEHVLSGHRKSIVTLALHPDGRRFATGGNDMTLRLWDTAGWQITAHWPAHTRTIITAAFSPDGRILASGGNDSAIHLWDVETGKRLRSIWGHTQPVERIAFHPTYPLLASGGLDDTLRLWDVGSGEQVGETMFHEDWISDLAFSPDGRLVASAGGDQRVRFWAVGDDGALRPAGAFQVPDTYPAYGIQLAFHPQGQLLACANDQAVYLVNLTSQHIVQRLEGHRNWVTGLAFTPDGSKIASVGYEKGLRLWDVESGTLVWKADTTDQVTCLRFDARGGALYACQVDGRVAVWDVATGALLRSITILGPYAELNIHGVTGISAAQRLNMLALGAVER